MHPGETQQEVYVSVDVETGGPVPGTHSLLSLGACVVGDTDCSYYVEIKPVDGTKTLPEALAVSGLDPIALGRSGADPAQAARDFGDWVRREAGDDQPVFVAFNAPFDWPFVVRLFYEADVANPFGHSALDIKAFYMGLAGTTWDATRSSQLPQRYRVEPEREHHALADAVAQAKTFHHMLRDRLGRRSRG